MSVLKRSFDLRLNINNSWNVDLQDVWNESFVQKKNYIAIVFLYSPRP